MEFMETKEERIQYVQNDIERLEEEYDNYKRRTKLSAIGAILCCICTIILTIIQFKIFNGDEGFNAFLIICLFTGTIILIFVSIFSYRSQAIYPENISKRKAALNLMKNDYEKYIESQNQAFAYAIKQSPITTKSDEINSPKCPICGSYSLSPITHMQKAGKVFLWGIFAAGDVSKTWKCNKCGSKF